MIKVDWVRLRRLGGKTNLECVSTASEIQASLILTSSKGIIELSTGARP
jgi:hypothetical protein